jgi:predicted transposase YbfD/YdcC
LKGNQGTLHADVSLFLDDPGREASDTDTIIDADNGRIETRVATVTTDIGWLQHNHEWPGLKCIGKVTRTRETRKGITVEPAYYLLSQPMSAKRFNAVVRSHWGIERIAARKVKRAGWDDTFLRRLLPLFEMRSP